MGVAGCGKSTIGKALSARFGATYLEGDDLHPPQNIALMSRGTPLSDDDRWPWLEKIAKEMASSEGIVFAGCSALRRAYRSYLSENSGELVFFIHLDGSKELIASRMGTRSGHFMPTALLDSQFETLEHLGSSEPSLVVNISGTEEDILQRIVAGIRPENLSMKSDEKE